MTVACWELDRQPFDQGHCSSCIEDYTHPGNYHIGEEEIGDDLLVYCCQCDDDLDDLIIQAKTYFKEFK